MLISKKELLAETGISYGQLYRWKREGLIPEEWFVKQSSFTGQETFFPKEQILNRIKAIQELKDNYSLEELAKLLSPEISGNGFSIEDLDFVEEIDRELMESYIKGHGKDRISYMEVLVLAILSGIRKDLNFSVTLTESILSGVETYLEGIKSSDYIFCIFTGEGQYYGVFYQDKASLFLDQRFDIVKEVRLSDISNEMKIKYRGKFKTQGDHYTKQGEDKDCKKAGEEAKEGEDTGRKQKKKKQDNEEFILKINNWEVRL